MNIGTLTLYHAPGTRSGRTKKMLDLLEVDYETVTLAFAEDEHKGDAYLALNPFGRVPTLVHNGRPILESAAQVMYLAELVPGRSMAPSAGSPERAAYYELFVLSPSELEPRASKAWAAPETDAARAEMDTIFNVLEPRITGPFALGDRLTAVDVFLHWGLRFFAKDVLERSANVDRYVTFMNGELDWTGY